MSALQFVTRAVEELRATDLWYNFAPFWDKFEKEKNNIQLLQVSRQVLSQLLYHFETRILTLCKHEKPRTYDTFEICNICNATRDREQLDDSGWNPYGPWSAWRWK